MTNVFLKVLDMSITASILVLVVLFLRVVFRRVPRFVHCILWAMVGLRLICPITIESAWSLIPDASPVSGAVDFVTESTIDSTTTSNSQEISGESKSASTFYEPSQYMIQNPFLPQVTEPLNKSAVVVYVITWAWVAGMGLLAGCAMVSYIRLHLRVREAVQVREQVWMCDNISTPFILGVIHPRIYIPSDLEEKQLEYVLAHENAHLKRHDHWWKPLGYLLLCVYWFHPFMWIAYILLCRDIELACDECVVKSQDVAYKKAYSTALLNCSVPRKNIAMCPLAFGEVGVKQRIKSVLTYKKPTVWMTIVAVAACIPVAVCFLTNPLEIEAAADSDLDKYLSEVILEQNRSEKTGNYYPCEAHTVLGVQENGENTVVYMMVLYQEYGYRNGKLTEESGSHMPVRITVSEDLEGDYKLEEYWIPRDGSYYARDLKLAFPKSLWEQTDTQKYVDAHHASCVQQAELYFGILGNEVR